MNKNKIKKDQVLRNKKINELAYVVSIDSGLGILITRTISIEELKDWEIANKEGAKV